jgi:phosphoribosylanthranilate isomerase
MWIKLCANTNLEDSLLCVDAGADALGFILAESARRVTAEQVGAITSHLPASVEKIGVFYTNDFDEITQAMKVAGLTGAQLHGGYDPALVERLRKHLGDSGDRISILQTMHWRTGVSAAEQAEIFAKTAAAIDAQGMVSALLVDSKTSTASGGTGVAFSWEDSASVLHTVRTRVVVAGGLRPENVAEAIRILHPWGVDVASSVEAAKGKKDAAKVRAFVKNAKAAGRETQPVAL